MALEKKQLVTDPTTGFGTKSEQSGGRFYRKDGSANIVRRGVTFWDQTSWYHTLISMPRWKFWLCLFSVYVSINLVFATIYFLIGIEHLEGVHRGSALVHFAEAFFFSAQTFTTVGYGRINPIGFWASAVAAFEAFLGLLAFALASGMFYGRFSKPRSYLRFSKVALISPYKDGIALMFRTASDKNNHLIDAEVKLTLAMRLKEGGEIRNKFFPLKIEFEKVASLVLNWTIVHPIDEESPLYGLTVDEMRQTGTELLVLLKAYDEVFANTVVARTSFTAYEFVDKAKFIPMYHPSPSNDATILEMDKLNDFTLLG